jgi:diguanylate cyclase (GGDEF)-like protein
MATRESHELGTERFMIPHRADFRTRRRISIVPDAPRHRRPRRSPEALALAVLFAGAAARFAYVAVVASGDGLGAPLGVALAVAALAMAAGTLVFGDRLPRRTLLAAAAVAVVLDSVIIAAAPTSGGIMAHAIGYAWLTVYVALFFPRAASWFAALVAAGFGLGLLASAVPGMLGGWLVVSVSAVVVSQVLSRISSAVQRHLKTDTLTGVLNRGGLEAAADRAFLRSRRRTEDLSVAVLDLDAFKAVNDREGHAGGDRLLAEAADAWRAALRGDDVIARTGGDEFVLIMPGTSGDQAQAVLSRLRGAHPVQWSAGVTRWRPGESLESCVARADSRLYAAKAARKAAAV